MKNETFKRITVVLIILLLGTAVSYAGADNGAAFKGVPVFMLCGALAFIVNWAAFVPANRAQTEKYYDLMGSATYLSVIAVAIVLTPELSLRAKLAALMVIVWTLRLGTFLFMRINQDGQDDRFDEIKTSPLRFFITWNLQALWVLFTSACALVVITSVNKSPMELIGYIGILMWIIGLAIEVVADSQKRIFKQKAENKGRFINVGLWSWSRHPNYFGEITLWTGMAFLAIPILSGLQWFTLISPLFVFLLLTKVSGVPLLAQKGQDRWGDEPEYQAYLKQTSLLIPMPPKKNQ